MKPLSIGLFGFLLVLVFSGASLRKPTPADPAPAKAKGAYYYWYTVPDDSFNDLTTTPNEENELFWEYDVIVDQNSAGGTLLMRGYINNAYPHNMPASIYLYGHF
ncbi:MAG TPA: hypothetical protein VNW04_14135 [Puia sp.]|jgi:hypothetical protein|nr:hypothetical protein [Puia sp.]